MVKRSILIGSLSGPYFAIRTAKMDRSRSDLTDSCSRKDINRDRGAYFRLGGGGLKLINAGGVHLKKKSLALAF